MAQAVLNQAPSRLRLSRHAFVRFWDVHAWAGVIAGLLLHVMFVAGALTLFHDPLALWQEPLAQQSSEPASLARTLDSAFSVIPSDARRIVFYPPKSGHGFLRAGSFVGNTKHFRQWWFDPRDGSVVAVREDLADFVFSLHYLWHELTGDGPYILAGLLAFALLLAIVSGVLIHVKDLARQFHQFRPRHSRRVLFSDLHKVLGVMGLPFQLTYAYTGALLILGPLVLGALAKPLFHGDTRRAQQAIFGELEPQFTEAGPSSPVLDLDALAERVRRVRPDLEPDAYVLTHHGHEHGTFRAQGRSRSAPFSEGEVTLAETDGRVVFSNAARAETSGATLYRFIYGIHYVRYGGGAVRGLLALLTLATSATILSGNLVFLARRESRRGSIGNRFLARLTAGVGGGTFVAFAALFLASRLLPLTFAARVGAEELIFICALGASALWSLAAPESARRWSTLFALAGALLLPVPFLAARWSSAGLFGSGPRIPAVLGVDVTILVVAAALLLLALRLRRSSEARHV